MAEFRHAAQSSKQAGFGLQIPHVDGPACLVEQERSLRILLGVGNTLNHPTWLLTAGNLIKSQYSHIPLMHLILPIINETLHANANLMQYLHIGGINGIYD